MNELIVATERDVIESCPQSPTLILNGWVVQNIVYELLANYFLSVPPEEAGRAFRYRYTVDDKARMANDSGILLDLGYNWKADVVGKRPAIFVHRGNEAYTHPTMGQHMSINARESEVSKLTFTALSITISCIAPEIGLVEELAEYAKAPLLNFQTEIQSDFGFRKFRLKSKSSPELVVESKAHFRIELGIEINFDEGCLIRRDDLKLKKVSQILYDSVTRKPFFADVMS